MPSRKIILVLAHDYLATALALLVAASFRRPEVALLPVAWGLARLAVLFGFLAVVVYWVAGLYESKWRFASLPDLFNIAVGAAALSGVLALGGFMLGWLGRPVSDFLGLDTALLFGALVVAFLGAPRLAYRYLRYRRDRRKRRPAAGRATILYGRAVDVEPILRAHEVGVLRDAAPAGILSPKESEQGLSIRGVPVLGGPGDLHEALADLRVNGVEVKRLLVAPAALGLDAGDDALVIDAKRAGLVVSRLEQVEEGGEDSPVLRLREVDPADMLARDAVRADDAPLRRFYAGRRVLVTGGGGSIGRDLCLRLAELGAGAVIALDNAEPALDGALDALHTARPTGEVGAALADVRDLARLRTVIAATRAEIVFHAAALKHVNHLERDWTEAIKTNVFGSLNVARAAREAGALAVLISTDKAIEPVSFLGATKRFAETVFEAVDRGWTGRTDAPGFSRAEPVRARLVSVRFGNVLGSAGSVLRKFHAQIAAGGPVTVTHPDVIRYFMTPREATDLVLLAAAQAGQEVGQEGGAPAPSQLPADGGRTEAGLRPSVYVLRMGKPQRILDLARRMIELAGFTPDEDIRIRFIGLRPGERLDEKRFAADETMVEVGIEGVDAALGAAPDGAVLADALDELAAAVASGDRDAARAALKRVVPSYKPADEGDARGGEVRVTDTPENGAQGAKRTDARNGAAPAGASPAAVSEREGPGQTAPAPDAARQPPGAVRPAAAVEVVRGAARV